MQINLQQETSRLIVAIGRMKSLKCVRCQMDWSMLSTSVVNDVTGVDRISCRHVFAYCANQRLDWQVYVHDVYKMDQVRQATRKSYYVTFLQRSSIRTESVPETRYQRSP
ncbi:hypothetical protein Ahy_Scaffold1g107089 isoform B [Arachis hypogaea]|uniref:Uncharacterized protein n=1 Tax=Arachis hypogaea TaxID=3818 RepID=A0A444WUG8_ARAHY|nr:hypothetical protein Ahy_Scaffold1g107089 isoform B [Arachis hypogaea]